MNLKAFVLLAYSCALKIGIAEATHWIDETFNLMQRHFWLAEHGLYANEADAQWTLSDYRGQNDNMHACEAMLAAFEARGDRKFLERATQIAENITLRQAGLTDCQIWEHFKPDWTPDLDYAKGDNSNNSNKSK